MRRTADDGQPHARNADESTLTAAPDVPSKGNLWGCPPSRAALTDRLDEQSATVARRMRQGLLAASVTIGLDVLDELLETEVTGLVGPKGKHDPDRSHKRHGSVDGTVALGGRQVAIARPRVRTADDTAEATLGVYETAKATDRLAERMVGAMLATLSTRRYGAALEPVGDLQAKGTSTSTVSAKFVAATSERLAELNRRPLDGDRWLIVFIDGFSFGQHLLVGALGVTMAPRSRSWLERPHLTSDLDRKRSASGVDFDGRRRELTDEIAALGPTLPGSLVSRSSRCGNRNCHCHTDSDMRHGPYWTWTRSVSGRTITRALTDAQAERYRPWFDNARRLRELVDQLKQLAIEQAETDHQWPTT